MNSPDSIPRFWRTLGPVVAPPALRVLFYSGVSQISDLIQFVKRTWAKIPMPSINHALIVLSGFALFWAWQLFPQFLIEAKSLEEIKIQVQKRPTPLILQIKLRRCALWFERDSNAHMKCINDAIDENF